jgi:hypothetical protein
MGLRLRLGLRLDIFIEILLGNSVNKLPLGKERRMVKLNALYGHPEDPEAFEEYYANTHLPLVEAIPNARRLETARVVATPDDCGVVLREHGADAGQLIHT